MLAAVPLAPSLMISWPVLTTTPMPSVDAGEIGRKSSQSMVPCGGLWFEDNFTSLLNFIIGWCGDMYYVFLQVDNWRDPYEQGSRMYSGLGTTGRPKCQNLSKSLLPRLPLTDSYAGLNVACGTRSIVAVPSTPDTAV